MNAAGVVPGDGDAGGACRRFDGRVAVVTGGASGIGEACARRFADEGAAVAIADLDEARGREVAASIGGDRAAFLRCDVASSADWRALREFVLSRWGRLDAFIGNAGMLGPITPLAHVEPSAWDKVMAVNVTANWRLLRALDPSLRASAAGRVVLVSSGAAVNCTAYWGPYSVSKAALEALARTYAAETVTTPVKVMLLNPGPLRTAMRAQAMPGEDPAVLKTADDLAPWFVKLASPEWTETGKVFDFPRGQVISR